MSQTEFPEQASLNRSLEQAAPSRPIQTETQVVTKQAETKRSPLHFVLSLLFLTFLMLFFAKKLDTIETFEDKIKHALVYANILIVFIAYVLLPNPPYTGLARRVFKFIQCCAFAYTINVLFAALLVS